MDYHPLNSEEEEERVGREPLAGEAPRLQGLHNVSFGHANQPKGPVSEAAGWKGFGGTYFFLAASEAFNPAFLIRSSSCFLLASVFCFSACRTMALAAVPARFGGRSIPILLLHMLVSAGSRKPNWTTSGSARYLS